MHLTPDVCFAVLPVGLGAGNARCIAASRLLARWMVCAAASRYGGESARGQCPLDPFFFPLPE